LSCLADTRLQSGDPGRAAAHYRQSLDLFRELGDRYAEASLLAHLGACHHLAGGQEAAREQWRQAHTLLDDLDPDTADQIHLQLSITDRSLADAFAGAANHGRRLREPAPRTGLSGSSPGTELRATVPANTSTTSGSDRGYRDSRCRRLREVAKQGAAGQPVEAFVQEKIPVRRRTEIPVR
jgi:hypothetical protein